MYFLLGAALGLFLISRLIRFLLFRKTPYPWKQILSTSSATVAAIYLAGYGLADGGPPKFIEAGFVYGPTGLILLVAELVLSKMK